MNKPTRRLAFLLHPASGIPWRWGKPRLGASMLWAAASTAMALPQDGTLVAGQATIARSATTTTVSQSSQRAAIDWKSFNVGASESVNFVQPNSSASILNRVLGNDASTIFGKISSNGTVLLLNPNGILFGRNAQVDVGSLLATTSNIGNADFMSGKLAFAKTNVAGAVVDNQGSISVGQAGFAALVGNRVSNSGVINARLSKVALAAGEAFVLDLYGDKLVNLVVDPAAMLSLRDASGAPLAARVDHSGQILADGGSVQLSSQAVGRLVDSIINVSGTIRATSFALSPGSISLNGDSRTRLELSGELNVSGAAGGRVQASAGEVSLSPTARISASGQTAGGSVSIGGDWQGQGSLAHASAVDIAQGAHIDASATDYGNGGTVAIWSDGATRFAGDILARGGASGGNGGQVEVSGKQQLGFTGGVDAAAPHGQAGSLLLDPANLFVTDAGSETLPGASLSGDYSVGVNALRRVLVAGTSVSLQATQDIAFDAVVDGRRPSGGVTGGGLSVNAGRDVNINQSIILNGGALDITAGRNVTQASSALLYTGTGAVRIAAAGNVSLGNAVVGSLTVRGSLSSDAASGGSFSLASGSSIQSAGLVDIKSAGSISTAADATVDSGGGGIVLNAGQAITIGAGSSDAASAGLHAAQAGDVTLTAAGDITAHGSLRTAGGTISLSTGSGNISVGQLQTNASATGSAGSAVLRATAGSVVLREALGGGNSGYRNISDGYQEALRPVVGRLDIEAAQTIETNGLNLDGTTLAGNVGAGYGLSLVANSPSGRVIVNKQIAVNKGDVRISSGGDVLLGASIYSRGWDPQNHSLKKAYAVELSAPHIYMWDNDSQLATIIDSHIAPATNTTFFGSLFLDPLNPNTDPTSVDSRIALPYLLPYTPLPGGPTPFTPLFANGFTVYQGGSYAPVYAPDGSVVTLKRQVAKLTIANNTANYVDSPSELVVASNAQLAGIHLNGDVQGLTGHASGVAIHAGDAIGAVGSIGEVQNHLTAADLPTESYYLKSGTAMSFASPTVVPVDLILTTPSTASGSLVFADQSTLQFGGANAALPAGYVIPAGSTVTGGLPQFTLAQWTRKDSGTNPCIIAGRCTNNGPGLGLKMVSYQGPGDSSTAPIFVSNNTGTVSSILAAQTPTAGAQLGSANLITVSGLSGTSDLAAFLGTYLVFNTGAGAFTCPTAFTGCLGNNFVTGTVVQTTGASGNAGTRLFLFPGVLASESNASNIDGGRDRRNNVATEIPSNSSRSASYSQIGGFSLSTLTPPGISDLPAVPSIPGDSTSPLATRPLTENASSLAFAEGPDNASVFSLADLGRQGGVRGAAPSVFNRAYVLAKSSNPAVCAPGVISSSAGSCAAGGD